MNEEQKRKHLVSSQKWYDMVVSKSKKDNMPMKQIVDNALENYFNSVNSNVNTEVNTSVNSAKSVNTLEENVNKILAMLIAVLASKNGEIIPKTAFFAENGVTLAGGMGRGTIGGGVSFSSSLNPSTSTLNGTVSKDNVQKEKINKKEKNLLQDFENFWKEYPKKEDKKPAWVAFQNAFKRNHSLTLDMLLKAVETQKNGKLQVRPKTAENPDGKKFIKMPSTWLNKECWRDESEDIEAKPVLMNNELKPVLHNGNNDGYGLSLKKCTFS
jgi:hypothetical protein